MTPRKSSDATENIENTENLNSEEQAQTPKPRKAPARKTTAKTAGTKKSPAAGEDAPKTPARGRGAAKKTASADAPLDAENTQTAQSETAPPKPRTARSAAKKTAPDKKAEQTDTEAAAKTPDKEAATSDKEAAPAGKAAAARTRAAAKSGTRGRKSAASAIADEQPATGSGPDAASEERKEAKAASEGKAETAAKKKTARTPAKSGTKTSARPAAKSAGRGKKAAAPVEDAAPEAVTGTSAAPEAAPRMPDAPADVPAAPETAASGPEAAAPEAAAPEAPKAPAAKGKRTPHSGRGAAKSAGRTTAKSTAKSADQTADQTADKSADKTVSGESSEERAEKKADAALPEDSSPVSPVSAAPASGPSESSPASAFDASPAESSESSAPADFPSGFDDWSPEEFFAAQEGEDGEAAEAEAGEAQGGKKRRSRSRRGGRGRKRSQTAPESSESAAPAPADEQTETDEADDFDDTDDAEETAAPAQAKEDKAVKSRRKMFVSVLPEEQIEVVITEEGQVQEYYVEMLHQAKTKGNIYKATVHNVDPNLQAAFVSYGAVKNGFLQIDEVHPEYYVSPHDSNKGRKYPPIQKVLKPGQELLVQVVKEPAGTKGAFLTTYLSMPGRFLVLTPGREQIGVSRKVDDEGERARLRELLEGLSPGPGLGVIVRTVSMGASKTSLQRDLQFLKRTWKEVRTRGTTEKAPCLVYQEMELTSRAVRDYLTDAIGEVWIDDEATASTVSEIAEALFPRKQNLVRVHKDLSVSLFERFNLQRQLDQIHSREVSLPSGGRLVIDPTEALTAIDINSGRSSGKNNFEDMAYRTNMEAARMIPLQLRLRDIGGQVVADFIEMRDKSHWREVEKTLRNGMKVDRARYDVGKIGPFGLLEIVRQRLGSSAISISTEPCPCCNGTGVRRNMEWQSQRALRDILRLLRNAQAQGQTVVAYEADQGVAMHLLNHKRQRLLDMEEQYGAHLDIRIRLSAVE